MTETGPQSYVQSERIRATAKGTLRIEGTGRDAATAGQVVFSALATAAWDAEAGIYTWEAASGGHSMVTELEVTEDGWAWEVPYRPTVLMRYETTYSHADRAWHEIGEMTFDGGLTWQPVMEMTLVKTCDA